MRARTRGSICTTSKRFIVVLEKEHGHALSLLSEEACLYAGAYWPSSSVSHRVAGGKLISDSDGGSLHLRVSGSKMKERGCDL